MNSKEMKKFFIIQYIIIGLLVVLCVFLILERKENSPATSEKQTITNNNGYDVSSMNEVDLDDVLSMFDTKKDYVLYIGRETCGVCKAVLPTLLTIQEEIGYTTQYLDITKVDRNSKTWEKVEKLLDIQTTLSVTNASGEKEAKKESFGYFVGHYGYTPTLIIISKNKMIAGHIGNITADDLRIWLQSNGIG